MNHIRNLPNQPSRFGVCTLVTKKENELGFEIVKNVTRRDSLAVTGGWAVAHALYFFGQQGLQLTYNRSNLGAGEDNQKLEDKAAGFRVCAHILRFYMCAQNSSLDTDEEFIPSQALSSR